MAHLSAEDDRSFGALIRDLRLDRGWSQGRLATVLCEASGRSTLTREEISRWERGRRTVGPFWLPHLADALQVPVEELEACRVRRRQFITSAAIAAAGLAPAGTSTGRLASDLSASIASGDTGPLRLLQTTHETDLLVSKMVGQDRGSVLHLARWMSDEDSDVLRVNAAGILAKTQHQTSMLDRVAGALRRDSMARTRYLAAVVGRVGASVPALADELYNARDCGARWCSAYLLGQDGRPAARRALVAALRVEPVRENVRSIGLVLNGADPCT